MNDRDDISSDLAHVAAYGVAYLAQALKSCDLPVEGVINHLAGMIDAQSLQHGTDGKRMLRQLKNILEGRLPQDGLEQMQ